MKKILFSDYDNTLYRNEDEIVKNIESINKFISKGNIFGIASGRSYIDIKNKLEKYNIPYNYLVLNHGATIFNKELNMIKTFLINNDIAKIIYDKLKDNDFLIEKHIYGINEKDIEINNEVVKLLFVFKNVKDVLKIKEYIDINYTNYVKTYISVNTSHITLELISNETNKSIGIKEILKIENIEKNNTYVIGDSYNDVEMIKEFNGYAMNNSIDYLKTITNKLCNSVSELINDII